MINFPDNFNLIFECITGSKLYGYDTPESDTDIRGVFIPTKEYFFGFKKIEQFEDKVNDITYWEIRKFIKLALDNNPNILELLFIPDNKILKTSKFWEEIMDNRHLFLSKNTRWKFAGYAHSQLNRIKRHRRWLLDPPKGKPERKDYGLPETRSLLSKDQIGAFNRLLALYLEEIKQFHPLREQLEEMTETHDFVGIIQSYKNMDLNIVQHILPISDNLIQALQRELSFGQAIKEWNSYQNWKKNRNPERAILEANFGYDTKHACSLYRLITEGEELLLSGNITFPRSDVELLRDIRNGKYSYDQLIEMLGDIDKHFDELYKRSILSKVPEVNDVEILLVNMIEKYLKEK